MKSRLSDSRNQCSAFEYSSSDSDYEPNTITVSRRAIKSSKNLETAFTRKNYEEKPLLFLSRKIRMLLFLFLILFTIVIDLDAGIIVSCYKQFIDSLQMSDFQYGSLNSINTIGKIIALVFYMLLINKNHRKLILVLNSIYLGIYFLAYFLSANYFYIASLRFLCSFGKVFIGVYMPVWIDQFGIKKYKTILMTINSTISPYGRIVGAWLGTVIFNNEWKKAFVCCALIFFILALLLFSIPQKYYSTKYMFVEKNKKSSEEDEEKLVLTKDETNNEKDKIDSYDYFDIKERNTESKYSTESKKKPLTRYDSRRDLEIQNHINEKLIDDINKFEVKKIKDLPILQKLKFVLGSGCLVFSSLSRACIYFDFKIIHIFLKKYAFEALGYKDEITFLSYYSITTLLSPSLGSLIGGGISIKFFGGYESKRSIWVIAVLSVISIIFITLIRMTNNFHYLIISIFGFFFTVSGYNPLLSGYIMKSLHKELKGLGSSFDSLITNFAGKLPAPIIYGTINDRYKNDNPKFAWNASLSITYIGLVFTFFACFFRWKQNIREVTFNTEVVEKTVQDAYNLNRSSLVAAKKHEPKINKKEDDGIELKNIGKKVTFKRTASQIIKLKLQHKFEEEEEEKNNNLEFFINGENIGDEK